METITYTVAFSHLSQYYGHYRVLSSDSIVGVVRWESSDFLAFPLQLALPAFAPRAGPLGHFLILAVYNELAANFLLSDSPSFL